MNPHQERPDQTAASHERPPRLRPWLAHSRRLGPHTAPETAHQPTLVKRSPAGRVRTAMPRASVTRVVGAEAPVPAPTYRSGRALGPDPIREVELPRPGSEGSSDSGRGHTMFFIFLAAIAVMVVVVWIAAAVNEWWILIPVIGVDLLVTAAVLGSLAQMLGDRRSG